MKHINIAELSGFMDNFRSGIFPALVTPWCDETLRGLVETRTPPSNYERLKLLSDALGGLAYLHQNRLAHRDVKGANILVKAESNLSNDSPNIQRMAYLTDFGFCKDIAQYLNPDISSTMQQSTQWMPPEYDGKGYHEARTTGDMWSFGCTFLEILRGNDPWHPVQDPQHRTLGIHI
ncbi:kinase-like protein [Rickenella mellea]|uniref:Kinase-like protein n=1 Tax=Rickenella mellea TaxID=50990 RepID=A0A4Y7Q1E9_9AGAM|nr:kinase-like protein [Rickenella mellea]